jgi:WD40 repeat protein
MSVFQSALGPEEDNVVENPMHIDGPSVEDEDEPPVEDPKNNLEYKNYNLESKLTGSSEGGDVNHVSFDETGDSIFVGFGTEIRKFNLPYNEKQKTEYFLGPYGNPRFAINSTSISSDETKVAIASGDIIIFDRNTNNRQQIDVSTYDEENNRYIKASAKCLAFKPGSSDIIAAGCKDGTIKIITGNIVSATFKTGGAPVYSIAFSNYEKIVSADESGHLQIWDATNGNKLHEFSVPLVRTVVFNNDGTNIATGSYDGTVQIWNTKTGEQLHKFQDKRYQSGYIKLNAPVAFSPNGTYIAAGLGYYLQIWDVSTGTSRQVIDIKNSPDSNIRSIAFSPNGERIVVGVGKTTKLYSRDIVPIPTKSLAQRFQSVKNLFKRGGKTKNNRKNVGSKFKNKNTYKKRRSYTKKRMVKK